MLGDLDMVKRSSEYGCASTDVLASDIEGNGPRNVSFSCHTQEEVHADHPHLVNSLGQSRQRTSSTIYRNSRMPPHRPLPLLLILSVAVLLSASVWAMYIHA